MDNLPDMDRLLSSYPGGAGDEQVIEALVALYRAGLYRLACSMLSDPDEAEDAVQQIFVRAALNLGRYQPGSNFKAWLYTLAVNVCRGLLRKRKAREALLRLLGRSYQADSQAGSLEGALEQRETAEQIWLAVERLHEKHRLVVCLRYQQGFTIAEIARVLGVREKTVYSRLYAALDRLRSQMEDERPAEGWSRAVEEKGMDV
jgi:RNA polymerase sigma-70 factor (ECF subfamily)